MSFTNYFWQLYHIDKNSRLREKTQELPAAGTNKSNENRLPLCEAGGYCFLICGGQTNSKYITAG